MNPRLIGGEMLVWSDLDGSHGPGPVRGRPLAALLATVAEGRTLVVGPHDPSVLDALSTDDLTLLVRGVPDAQALATRYPGATVCCGGLEKLATEPAYDTVVALDGLGRVASVEGDDLDWGTALDVLLAALGPGGTLVLGVENYLGLHRLVALPRPLTDTDWVITDEHDLTRPAGFARVVDRLAGAGLRVGQRYAAFPSGIEPAALLGTDLLGDDEVRGFVAGALDRACAPVTDVLADPARIAVTALRHGAAAELAPAWVLVAGRAGRTPPAALIGTGPDLVEVTRSADGRWAHGSGAVAPGRTLEDLLLSACLRRDLPAVRELLGGWQSGPTAGVAAGLVIVGADGRLTAVGPDGGPAAALRELAARLIEGGFAHPWPAVAGEDELAFTLAALAGRELDPTELASAGRAARPRRDTHAMRELAADRDRLARELAEARAKALWYEQMLTRRDDALNRAQRIIGLLSRTGPARAGAALMGGAKAARRTVRVVAKRIRPRG